MARVAITGAAGRLGTALRSRLGAAGHEIVAIDLQVPEVTGGEEWAVADVRDRSQIARVVTGADALIHLAGHPGERPWRDIVDVNIGGMLGVLEAAVSEGVPRVLHASSVHASGFEPMTNARMVARPDGYYGVGKIAAEAMASVYADRFGLAVVSARIGNFTDRPDSIRGLSMWLSPDDAGRLAEAAVRLDKPGHHVVWGVSRNSRGVLDLTMGEAVGYYPVDDAESFAAEVESATALQADAEPIELLGAGFTVRQLGG